jgi:TolA-binding protein
MVGINRYFAFNLLGFVSLLLTANTLWATPGDPVGKITYLEGKVEVSQDDAWVPVKVNHQLLSTQTIRTPGNGMAEILWSSGQKTIIGPNSSLSIGELAAAQKSDSKTKTEGITTNFRRLFIETADAGRREEGGIRRSKGAVGTDVGDDALYWKQEREISFDEAAAIYEAGEYPKAIAAFHAFLQQKPDHQDAPLALFGIGHAYIEVNNPIGAKQVFEDFLLRYPGHNLSNEVRSLLQKL